MSLRCLEALTSEHGISHGADNVGCQTGDNYLYVFKAARSARRALSGA